MTEESTNGRVTLKDLYERVDSVRLELGGKLDSLADDLTAINKTDNEQNLRIQELQLWTKSRDNDLQVKLDSAFEKHMAVEHSRFTQTSTRVWVMWGIGIFIGMIAAQELVHYVIEFISKI